MFEVLFAISLTAGLRGEMVIPTARRMLPKLTATALFTFLAGMALDAPTSELEFASIIGLIAAAAAWIEGAVLSSVAFWLGRAVRAARSPRISA